MTGDRRPGRGGRTRWAGSLLVLLALFAVPATAQVSVNAFVDKTDAKFSK